MKLRSIVAMLLMVLLLAGCGDEKKEEKSNAETNKELYCEEGTLKDGKCEVVLVADATYTCENGYTLTDGSCVKTETKAATSSKTCASGYTLSGNQCVSNEDVAKNKIQVCELPSNLKTADGKYYTEEIDGHCVVMQCVSFEGKTCMESGTYDDIPYTVNETCPSGTKEINGKCKKTATPTNGYTCEKGELSGKNCIIETTVDATGSCEDDYSYNNETKMCEKINLVDAQEK